MQSAALSRIGATPVLTAITEDEAFMQSLFASPHVDRLNLGPIPANKVSWGQPHEGNLFAHLYRRHTVQR